MSLHDVGINRLCRIAGVVGAVARRQAVPLAVGVQSNLVDARRAKCIDALQRLDFERSGEALEELFGVDAGIRQKPVVRFQAKAAGRKEDRQEMVEAEVGCRGTAMVAVCNVGRLLLIQQADECFDLPGIGHEPDGVHVAGFVRSPGSHRRGWW